MVYDLRTRLDLRIFIEVVVGRFVILRRTHGSEGNVNVSSVRLRYHQEKRWTASQESREK